MATKKKAGTQEHEHSLLERIGGQALHLKDEIIAGKDHLMEAAGEKIDAVKTSIKEFTQKVTKPAKKLTTTSVKEAKKAAAPKKKAAVKAAPANKKAARKKTTPKKAASKKPAPKKSAKSIARKR